VSKSRREFDIKRVKEKSRDTFKENDLRTRVKPIKPKREKGGGNNWRNWYTGEEVHEDN